MKRRRLPILRTNERDALRANLRACCARCGLRVVNPRGANKLRGQCGHDPTDREGSYCRPCHREYNREYMKRSRAAGIAW